MAALRQYTGSMIRRHETGQREARTNIRLPQELLDGIRQTARENERSINSEIVWVLRDYLRRREQPHQVSA